MLHNRGGRATSREEDLGILTFVKGTLMHVDIYAQSLQDRTMDLNLLDLSDFILGMYHMCPYNRAL